MATLVDTVFSCVLGIAWLLGLWLIVMAGSLVLWEAMRRWSTAHIEARAQRPGLPSTSRFD